MHVCVPICIQCILGFYTNKSKEYINKKEENIYLSKKITLLHEKCKYFFYLYSAIKHFLQQFRYFLFTYFLSYINYCYSLHTNVYFVNKNWFRIFLFMLSLEKWYEIFIQVFKKCSFYHNALTILFVWFFYGIDFFPQKINKNEQISILNI